MTKSNNNPPDIEIHKAKSDFIPYLLGLLVIDLILSSRILNVVPPWLFWLTLTVCVATPFFIKSILKQNWSKSGTVTLSSVLLLISFTSLLVQNALKQAPPTNLISTSSETSTGESSTPETSLVPESPKPYIKLKDIEIIDMGGGVAEVDFKADSSLPADTELEVAIRKDTLTKDGFRRCSFYTRSTYRQLGPVKYGHLKPFTVEELANGTGSTINEKDSESRLCDDFHYAPEKPRKLYPILRIDVSREEESAESVQDIVDIPWSKAHKFY
jgi:hypothetical protein